MIRPSGNIAVADLLSSNGTNDVGLRCGLNFFIEFAQVQLRLKIGSFHRLPR